MNGKNATTALDAAVGTTRPLPQLLTYRIARLHLALDTQATVTLANTAGISLAQWRHLVVIGSGQARTAKDIVKFTGMDPGFVSRTLRQLENDGLLKTKRPHDNRRILTIELTAKGAKTYHAALPAMQARQEFLLGSLNASEQRAIFRIIDKLEIAAKERNFEQGK